MPTLIRLLLASLVLWPASTVAAASAWPQAESAALWTQAEWLRLGHYKAGIWPGSWSSQADDARFFLAADGATNPRAEMEASLDAFAAPADLGDQHAQCRFVARFNWLRSRLDLGELPQPDCLAYREFRTQVQATRAVLIFPSYYLNSPSSMFGHTLLRLDAGADDSGSDYLSFAINFGALVDPSDNGLFYAFRGLTGGYPGQFEVDRYYKKIRDYNRDENRDIWEYPLNLSAEETERLIQHLWELRGINFAYYFFDENCSYRILELLEVARPGLDLTGDFPLTAIPIDTVRAVERAGLVEGKHFRPAQGTALRQRLATVPESLHEMVIELSESPESLETADLQALDPAIRAALIDAAYKYLRYTQTGAERDLTIAERSFRLLQALQLQAADLPAAAAAPDPASSPDLSHGSRRLALGLWNEEERDYLSLGLRMSLHSLAENRNGFPAGAQINIGNIDLRIEDDGQLDVNRFDLVDIVSLSPRDRFFKPLSWAVTTGVERQWTGGAEHRVAHVNGGAGMTRSLWSGSQVYGMTTARLEHNHGFEDPLQPALGLRGGWLQDLGVLTLHWELGAEKFANGEDRARVVLRHNLRVSRNQALHLEMLWRDQQPDDTLAVGLRYQYYY
ncbi:MAG: Lnb N-terminal periplasmic domain-containing protein [Panacagrimonas sp.]